MEGNQKYSLNSWKLWIAGETMDEAVNASLLAMPSGLQLYLASCPTSLIPVPLS